MWLLTRHFSAIFPLSGSLNLALELLRGTSLQPHTADQKQLACQSTGRPHRWCLFRLLNYPLTVVLSEIRRDAIITADRLSAGRSEPSSLVPLGLPPHYSYHCHWESSSDTHQCIRKPYRAILLLWVLPEAGRAAPCPWWVLSIPLTGPAESWRTPQAAIGVWCCGSTARPKTWSD